MGHLTSTTLTTRKPLLRKFSKTQSVITTKRSTANFYANPVYLDQTLIYVDFSLINKSNKDKIVDYSSTSQSLRWPKLLLCALLAFAIIYFQYGYNILNENDTSILVTKNLLQLGNDPELSANVITILNLTIF